MGRTRATKIKKVENAARALELRKAGSTLDQIATTMGLNSRQHVHYIISTALNELIDTCTHDADEYRRMQLERLDAMELALWPQRKNPRVCDSLIKIEARRAALLGLDAPAKTALTDTNGNDVAVDLVAIRAKLLG
jgi:hypothetical protein